MILLSNKKTNVILCVGNNIQTYEDDFYIDNDTHMLYMKNTINKYNVDTVDSEVLINPSKYMYVNDTIQENPYYKEPYTLTESMYTEIQSNIDYLMLLNDSTDE